MSWFFQVFLFALVLVNVALVVINGWVLRTNLRMLKRYREALEHLERATGWRL